MSGIQPVPTEVSVFAPQSTVLFPQMQSGTLSLQRIGEIRKSQNLSIASLARRMNLDVSMVRAVENPSCDMFLSELYKWRAALDVPMFELVVEPEELPANPLRNRGLLLRIMKTVRSLMETARDEKTKSLAKTLADQLIELMPELSEVAPWPKVGQARDHKDYGQAMFRRFDPGVSAEMED